MDLINEFRKTLVENGDSASRVTVKNYAADINKFISWYWIKYQRPFPPPALPQEIVQSYLDEITATSPRSAKRYQSSLKKFFTFLVNKGALSSNPLTNIINIKANSDPFRLKEFGSFLYTSNASPVTTKNYILDIRQFLNWAQIVGPLRSEASSGTDVLANLDTFMLEEYKNRLINETRLSPLSVNRKLSSLRKYIFWADSKNLLKNRPQVSSALVQPKHDAPGVTVEKNQIGFDSDLLSMINPREPETEASEPHEFSRFPPLRLFQKGKWALNFAFDSLIILSFLKTIEAIKYNFWKSTGKQVFASLSDIAETENLLAHKPESLLLPNLSVVDQFVTMGEKATIGKVSSIPKSVYAPLKISTEALPFSKKLLFNLLHTRPQWYKKYHSYAFVHYLHFAIVLVFASFAGFNIYQAFQTPISVKTVLSSKVAPGRLISFQGKLNDSLDTPINRESILKFAIYNSQTASGSALLWQETQIVQPDAVGIFSTVLGRINKIEQDIFNNNPNLYLGISIGTDPELIPRQELANVGLTKNTEELQGLKPITGNNAGTRNVILALDSSGNLTIGGNSNPVFQATGGEFKLSGQQLTLATNEGTNTNIVLNPDGTGIIDMQKPLQNTSDDNNPDSFGAVQINDIMAINATSNVRSALVINQNGTSDLISASTGGTAKLTLSNSGSLTLGEDLHILGNNLTAVTGTFNLINTNALNLNIGGAATSISLGAKIGNTTINHDLAVSGVIKAASGIILNGFIPGSIPFIGPANQVTIDSTSFFWDQTNKRLGIGTNLPSYKVSAIDNLSAPGTAVTTFTNLNSTDNVNANVLRLNSGVTSTGTNARFITFYAGCASENCSGVGVGNIHQVSGGIALQSGTADFAERFRVEESTEPGDVIGTDTFSNRKAQSGDRVLGVISDSAIVIGNSPDNIDKDKNPIVGLLGQIRTKVTSANGEIKKGDPLSISSTPGAAAKATADGEIIGTALEDFRPSSNQAQNGRILVLVRPSWYQTKLSLNNSGKVDTQFEANKSATASETSDTNLDNREQIVLSIQSFIDTLRDGVLEVRKISVQSLAVATEDITIGTLTLREYIASIVNEIIDRRLAAEHKQAIIVVSPLAEVSASSDAELAIPIPSLEPTSIPTPSPSPSPISNQPSITNITNVYNNASGSAIASPSATPTPSATAELTPTPSLQPSATPSATPTPTIGASPITNPQPTTTEEVRIKNPSNSAGRQELSDKNASISADAILNTKYLPAGRQGSIHNTADVATYSAELSYIPNLKSDFATFNSGLIALGPTSLSETTINGQLSVGQSLQINENSINTISSELNLQSLRQDNLSIMGGLVTIDTTGNLTVKGNASFAKDVNIKGKLAAGVIAPVPDSDLIFSLGSKDDQGKNTPSSLVINNQKGESVVKVNQLGDIISSGSAQFTNFKIVRGAQADTSFTQTIASGSAGTAIITTNETERTIITPYVAENSLIYITPVSDTLGLTPFIARQTIENSNLGTRGSFTIQVPHSVSADIKLNWWIIN